MFDWGKGSGSSSHNSSIWLYQGCKVLTAPVFGCNKVSRLTSLGWLVSSKFSLFLPLKELSLFWKKKWKCEEEPHSAPILLESVLLGSEDLASMLCMLESNDKLWIHVLLEFPHLLFILWNIFGDNNRPLESWKFLDPLILSHIQTLWNVFSSNYDLFGYG